MERLGRGDGVDDGADEGAREHSKDSAEPGCAANRMPPQSEISYMIGERMLCTLDRQGQATYRFVR